MKALATRLDRISPSPTIALTTLAKVLRAQGRDVLSLTAGEPDFDTPAPIKAAAVQAVKRGLTKYTDTAGAPDLIAAVARKFKRDNGLDYAPGEIVVSSGAKHSIFNALLALINPGDQVIVPSPYWVTYPVLVSFLGGEPVIIRTAFEDGYKSPAGRIREAVTVRTKAIILNSPCNPSGAVYSREELEAIGRVAVENDLYIIADEVYEKIIYDGRKHVSIASLSDNLFRRTVTVNGVSKAFAMTGWRIGYLGAPEALARPMAAVQSQSTHHPSTIAMAAACAALDKHGGTVARMVKAFDGRRRFLVDALNSMPGVRCAMPQGSFYAFPDVSAL
jgi:aspartate aminotransferase